MSPARERSLRLHARALDDLAYWIAHDRKVALRLLKLMEASRRSPFEGMGKPEPLKHFGPDIWSRRITREDRLVYRVTERGVDILQARRHY